MCAASLAKPPVPSTDRVHYDRPEAALALPPSLGTAAAIEKVATDLGPGTFEDDLQHIAHWMSAHLAYSPDAAYAWRDFDRIVADGTIGGCADYAEVYGALARALGIPVVWVKTMDIDWIRAFRAGPEPETWSGHVFLELWDGGRWVLLDPEAQILYPDYDPQTRLLPGDRLAYDKGTDPYALVLSTRWKEWQEQTRAWVLGLDPSLLPVGTGRPVAGPDRVFVAGDNPGWQLAVDRVHALGLDTGFSGNTGFEEWMPQAQGNVLVLLDVGGVSPLPQPWQTTYARPAAANDLASGKGWSIASWSTSDGTHVVDITAADEATLGRAVPALQLRPDRADGPVVGAGRSTP
jgi:hypothetical protein